MPLRMSLKHKLRTSTLEYRRDQHKSICKSSLTILKPDESIRLIVDYRLLNEKMAKDQFPFPNINDTLENLNGAKSFSKINLVQGYYQIPMDPESQKYTAFVVPCGHFEFTKMPFGLANAPRTFQRIFWTFLHHIPQVKIFLDDILIFTKENEDHLEKVKEVVTILHNNGLEINCKKSKINKNEITYLGRKITQEGITAVGFTKPNMTEYVWPKSKRKLQSLIGFINWYREFLPKVSERMFPITEKLKQKTPYSWTIEEKETIERLFKEICQQPIINHVKPNIPFHSKPTPQMWELVVFFYKMIRS